MSDKPSGAYYSDRLNAERLRRCYEVAPPRVQRYLEAEIGFTYPLAMGGALIGVAVLATIVPAQRASGVTPVMALKE